MMLSLLVVMIVLVGIINITYTARFISQSYETVDYVHENSSFFPMAMGPAPSEEDTGGPGAGASNGTSMGSIGPGQMQFPDGDSHLTEDTKFETSYFSVDLDSSDTITHIDHGQIATVSESEIETYVEEILSSEKTKGRIDYFLYKVYDEDDGTRTIVAVSCFQQFRQSRMLLMISILAAILYMAAVFLLVWFMSKRVTRPVEESIQKQRQFITDAGHELKTPITIISTNAEVLQMQGGSNQWLDSIKNQTKRLNTLVKSLLELSKLNEASVPTEISELNLSATVKEASESFLVPAESAGKSIELDISPDITINGSREELYRLVVILMDNALKYSDGREPIRLTLKKQHKISLSVFNTCEYVDPAKVDKLFERFYRADESRSRQTGGSGIGLAIAQAIVDHHKGQITASTEDGTSICFTAVF